MGKIAFVFAGQGAQYTGMGKELYESSPAARKVFDLRGVPSVPARWNQCFSGLARRQLSRTAQHPALPLCRGRRLRCGADGEAGIYAD